VGFFFKTNFSFFIFHFFKPNTLLSLLQEPKKKKKEREKKK